VAGDRLLDRADLFSDRGNGIADLVDGQLQLILADFQMLRPAAIATGSLIAICRRERLSLTGPAPII
jgi:hypothetical protein